MDAAANATLQLTGSVVDERICERARVKMCCCMCKCCPKPGGGAEGLWKHSITSLALYALRFSITMTTAPAIRLPASMTARGVDGADLTRDASPSEKVRMAIVIWIVFHLLCAQGAGRGVIKDKRTMIKETIDGPDRGCLNAV
jgi:hypothetical protein